MKDQIPSLVKIYLFFDSAAASSPGRVDVKIQTSDGQYLGSTVFTYVDEDQEVFRRFITSNRLQSKFFSFLAQELAVRESKTEKDGTSKCSSECLDSWYVREKRENLVSNNNFSFFKCYKTKQRNGKHYLQILVTTEKHSTNDAGVICNVLLYATDNKRVLCCRAEPCKAELFWGAVASTVWNGFELLEALLAVTSVNYHRIV